MNRKQALATIGVGALSVVVPKGAAAIRVRGDGYKTIPFYPYDTNPYFDPMTLKPDQVDKAMWDAVHRINQSGWVWTAESCQGHRSGVFGNAHYNAWSHSPEIRLVCRSKDLADLMGIMYDTVKSETLKIVPMKAHPRTGGDPRGWADMRVYAGNQLSDKFDWQTVVSGREYFMRLANRLVVNG